MASEPYVLNYSFFKVDYSPFAAAIKAIPTSLKPWLLTLLVRWLLEPGIISCIGYPSSAISLRVGGSSCYSGGLSTVALLLYLKLWMLSPLSEKKSCWFELKKLFCCKIYPKEAMLESWRYSIRIRYYSVMVACDGVSSICKSPSSSERV
jgi:hypothetical protein